MLRLRVVFSTASNIESYLTASWVEIHESNAHVNTDELIGDLVGSSYKGLAATKLICANTLRGTVEVVLSCVDHS